MKLIEWLQKQQFYKPNRKDGYKTDDERLRYLSMKVLGIWTSKIVKND